MVAKPKKDSPDDTRPGQENLIPFDKLTQNEQRKIAKKGGKASGEARRKKRNLREKFEIAMSIPLLDGSVVTIDDVDSFANAKNANMTLEDRMIMQITRRAANGDIRAYELIRDQIGQKPADKNDINVNGTLNINPFSDLTTDELREALESIKRNKKID